MMPGAGLMDIVKGWRKRDIIFGMRISWSVTLGFARPSTVSAGI